MKTSIHRKALMNKIYIPCAVLLAAASLIGGCWLDHRSPAETNAKEYSKTMIPDAEAFSCLNVDSDHNGYVTCSIKSRVDGLVALECAGAQWAWDFPKNSGCKPIPKILAK